MVAALLAGTSARAGDDPLRLFAVCAGRLSAQMEHQWVTDGPASEGTKRARDAMAELAEAITPPGMAAEVMSWRIAAKVAQAALLAQARHGADPQGHAAARAETLVAQCRGLMLG